MTGSGSLTDPWVLSSPPDATGLVRVADTVTLDLELLGTGGRGNPYIISGNAKITDLISFVDTAEVTWTRTGTGAANSPYAMTAELPWLASTIGSPGEVMTLGVDGTWAPGPPNQVAPGVIIPGQGISGDGSGAAPLRVDICTYDDLKAACAP